MRSVILCCLALAALLAPVRAAEEPTVTKDQVKAAAAEIEKLTKQQMEATGVPGVAIAIVYKGEVILTKGFGVRDAGKKDSVDADTVFQLASLSKPISSTVIAAVASEGSVRWDSRISDLDPGFLLYDPWITREVTVGDLYAHRSGLPAHAGDLLEEIGYQRADILYRLRYQPPVGSFRTTYAYTNFGLTEAALAVARALGTTWEELSADKLYRPLGMALTSSRYVDFRARPNRAPGHVLVDGKWVQKYQRYPDSQSPAGGVSSSANDLARWLRLLLGEGQYNGREIVKQKVLIEAWRPQIYTGKNAIDGLPNFSGYGWNVTYDAQGRLRVSHSGAFEEGAATAAFLVPSEQLGIVVLTNAYPIGLAEGLGQTFLDLALKGAPTTDWFTLYRDAFAKMMTAERAADYSKPPETPSPASAASAYTGSYANALYGDIAVTEKDGALSLVLGPKKMTFPLKHWNRDTFLYQGDTASLATPASVTFTLGPDGRATQLTIENFNEYGQGVFPRTGDAPKP